MKFTSLILATAAAVTVFAGSAGPAAAGQTVRLRLGMQTPGVAVLQEYLRLNRRWNYLRYDGGYTGFFGSVTRSGLKGWQTAAGYKPTGWIAIGSGQWNKLRSEELKFSVPYGVSKQAVGGARQTGWAIDASKRTHMLYLLRYQPYRKRLRVVLSTPTSFGGCNSDGCFVTPSGVFPIYRKAGKDEVSHEWKDSQGNPAPMPYSLYFTGGVAVHYDPLGNSHECVHVPSWSDAAYMYVHVPLGSLVVVHN